MKKIILYITIVFFSLNAVNTTAQSTTQFSKLIRYQPDSGRALGFIPSLAYDSVANRIYFSLSNTPISTHLWTTHPVMYKMDVNGNILALREDSISNSSNDYTVIVRSKFGPYLYWGGIAFDTSSYWDTSHITEDFVITKTDTNLHRIWRKRFINQGYRGSYFSSLIENKDGSLMALGTTWTQSGDSVFQYSPTRGHFLHIDSAGHLLWSRQVGPDYYNLCYGMTQSDDGNFLIAGRTFSWGYTTSGAPFVLKADTAGTELWHKTYLPNNYTTWAMGIIRTQEAQESYITFGQTAYSSTSGTAYMNKIDVSGNQLWERTLSIGQYPYGEFWAACNAGNGDLLGVGSSEGATFNYAKGLLVRFNKDGNIKWSREIQPDTSVIPYAYLYNVVALKDGSFVAVGSGDGYGDLSTNSPTQAGWVVRVDSNGCLSPDCQNLGISPVAAESPAAVQVFPNPTKGRITIKREKPFSKGTSMVLLDRLGRNLESFTAPAGQTTVSYDLKGLAPGIYFLEINQNDQKIIREINLLR